MLKYNDKVALIDIETNEIVDVFEISNYQGNGYYMVIDGKKDLYEFDSNLLENGKYELLTKDHEQRYKEFCYKKTVNEWFKNKEFTFEEKDAMYNKSNVILATAKDKKLFFDAIENPREPNEALKDAFKSKNKFFTDNDF